MWEDYKTNMLIRSRILLEDISSLTDSLQRIDQALMFLQNLLFLLQEDNFILLDDTLKDKIRNFSNALILQFKEAKILKISDVTKINRMIEIRELIKKKLQSQKSRYEKIDSSRKVEALVQQEIKDRQIPNSIPISKQDIIEMYKRDFENYSAMCHHDISKSKIDLFYYLTTVHKICTYDLEYAKVNRIMIAIAIEEIKKNASIIKSEEVLEAYIESTNRRLQLDSNQRTYKKVIPFLSSKQ